MTQILPIFASVYRYFFRTMFGGPPPLFTGEAALPMTFDFTDPKSASEFDFVDPRSALEFDFALEKK